jgi:hypothetical protein
MTSESSITVFKGGGMSFSGPDAVELFRAATLKSALGLLSKGIRPTRGLTMTKALKMVTEYTGQTYKRSVAEAERARTDLTVWIETMKSAIPVERKD